MEVLCGVAGDVGPPASLDGGGYGFDEHVAEGNVPETLPHRR